MPPFNSRWTTSIKNFWYLNALSSRSTVWHNRTDNKIGNKRKVEWFSPATIRRQCKNLHSGALMASGLLKANNFLHHFCMIRHFLLRFFSLPFIKISFAYDEAFLPTTAMLRFALNLHSMVSEWKIAALEMISFIRKVNPAKRCPWVEKYTSMDATLLSYCTGSSFSKVACIPLRPNP